MAEVNDILMDEQFNPVIKNGDFFWNESTSQHQKLLIVANKGQFRESPTVGVGINNFLLDDGTTEELKQEIILQFELDGMQINDLLIKDVSNVQIDAEYK